MKAEKIFDYLKDESQEKGINIGIVFNERDEEEIDSRFVPESLESAVSVERVAVYIGWYTEVAWLFIEDTGVGFEEMEEIFDALDEVGLQPYEFEEISRRYQDQIEIIDIGEGFEIIDRKESRYFTTESSDNPMDLSNKDNTKEIEE